MNEKLILDACCSSRAMWFDKQNPHAIYMDIRKEDAGFIECRPTQQIQPDIVGDFRKIPYPDKSFKLVTFDPPHICDNSNSVLKKEYGELTNSWKDDISRGWRECMRVLDDYGVLTMKWSTVSFSVKEVLSLFPIKPLYGSRINSGGRAETYWWVWMKIPAGESE
jgi:hypothetical protein